MTAIQWFNTVLNNLLNIVVWPVFFGVSIIMFVWAGILFLTAQGEPDKLTSARKAVIWGIIGIFIAILGFSITNIISTIFPQVPQV